MPKAAFALAALISATAAGSAWAISPSTFGMMGDPVLIKMPTTADLAGVAPAAAKAGGRALIQCAVARDGSLRECAVLQEHPVRSGFGQAAVRVSQRFRIGPRDFDRSPTAGAALVLPVMFGRAD